MKIIKTENATYHTRPAFNDPDCGTFFYTSCCNNTMYSVRGKMAYDGAICPCCWLYNKKKVILHFKGGFDWEDEKERERLVDQFIKEWEDEE